MTKVYTFGRTLPRRKLETSRQFAERITACRDPKDDKFLELTGNGHADLIISGDADLLALNPFRQIPILTPAAFVQASTVASAKGGKRLQSA